MSYVYYFSKNNRWPVFLRNVDPRMLFRSCFQQGKNNASCHESASQVVVVKKVHSREAVSEDFKLQACIFS